MTMRSVAYEQGYTDYYAGAETFENPFSFYEEYAQWSEWCDGHMKAYCEDEGK